MSEPVVLERILGHFAKPRARKTLCGRPAKNPGAYQGVTGPPSPCVPCVSKAGKLLTPKQASPLELEAERLIAAAGLPAPVKQHAFAEAIGRRWRFDFAWPDRRVALEIDGDLWNGRHTSGDGRQADMVRDAWATSNGWNVFRVDSMLLRQGYALRWVRRMLGLDSDIAYTTLDFPDERTLAPKRWERKRAKAQARRNEARA